MHQHPAALRVRPPGPLDHTLRPPGSKSLTNRALLLAALADGRSTLTGCLESEDTILMRAALARLGARSEVEGDGTRISIEGLGGPPRRVDDPERPIEVGTAGTAARFLAAVLAASPITTLVDGSPRMRERPMALLLETLRAQGAAITCLGAPGSLPARIEGSPGGLLGGEIRLARPPSSQFISALILAAPLARAPTRIILEQGTPARPYVDMSLALLRDFGGRGGWTVDGVEIEVSPGALRGRDMAIEPDASAASYFLAMAAIFGGRVTIPDLGAESVQGDAGFCHVLAAMGAEIEQSATQTTLRGRGPLRGIDIDLAAMPDMTLTLAVAALHARGPTRIRGVEILRHHESDRLAAAAAELRKLGARVDEAEDGLLIDPPAAPTPGVAIDTYEDHRMAMAFSLAGEVTIRDPGCVRKTFPAYFEELARLGMVVT